MIEASGVLKDLKTQEDVSRLLKDLHLDLIEAMLHGELESHLGYAKNEKSENINAGNGKTSKRLKTEFGEDILVTVTDNLNGFTGAITNVFPLANTQICVVHQIRNSARYVVWKDKKEFAEDMKLIYNAPNRDMAKVELERFARKWGHINFSLSLDNFYSQLS